MQYNDWDREHPVYPEGEDVDRRSSCRVRTTATGEPIIYPVNEYMATRCSSYCMCARVEARDGPYTPCSSPFTRQGTHAAMTATRCSH